MRIGKRMLLWGLLPVLLLVACAADAPEDTAPTATSFAYSLLPEGSLPIPSYPEYELSVWKTDDEKYLNFRGDIISVYNSGADILSVRLGKYVSSQTEGATLEIQRDRTFLYERTRRYTHRGENPYAFDLVFQVSGYVLPAEGGVQLCVTDATVTYAKTEESDLALNAALQSNALNLNESQWDRCQRMLAGEELTVDDFYGIGTFGMMTSEPVVAALDGDAMAFALDRPFLPYAIENAD